MSHPYGIEEYKGIRAIYPPTPGTIHNACTSCGKDVKTDCGFAEPAGKPYKAYLCKDCAVIAIGGDRCAELLLWAQETYRRTCNGN